MNKAEQLVAEFKEQLPDVISKQQNLKDSLSDTLDTLSADIWYADKVLYQEDVTDALNAAYRSVVKAIDLIK
jgi:hypothetical protein